MNKKNLIIQELQLFSNSYPHYTFGEILYAFQRLNKTKRLQELTDDEILDMIRKAELIEVEL